MLPPAQKNVEWQLEMIVQKSAPKLQQKPMICPSAILWQRCFYLWEPLKIQFSRQDKARVKKLSAAYI